MRIKNDEIIGNAGLVSFVKDLVDFGNLPTAILLAGPPMIGKTKILESVAIRILCENGSGCGSCMSCKLGTINHPDVLRQVSGEEESLRKGISALVKRLNQSPVISKNTVVFLENIDVFSREAAPLLLKALEDSPSFVKFFLTASSLDVVLPTIRSRCMIRQVFPLERKDLQKIIFSEVVEKTDSGSDSQTGANDVDLNKRITNVSGGRPGLMIRLIGDAVMRDKYFGWYDFIRKMPLSTTGEKSMFASEIEKSDNARELLSLYQYLLREEVKALSCGGEKVVDWPLKSVVHGLKKSREAVAMIKANVPQRLVLEYVIF